MARSLPAGYPYREQVRWAVANSRGKEEPSSGTACLPVLCPGIFAFWAVQCIPSNKVLNQFLARDGSLLPFEMVGIITQVIYSVYL